MDPVFGILIWRLKDIDWLDGVHVWNSETAVMMTWSVRQISNTSCEKEGTKCFTIFWKVTFIFCFFPILELLRSQTIFVLLVLIPSFNLLLTQTMEEIGAFVAATFIMKPDRQPLEQFHHDGRCTCQFRPEQSDYSFSTSRFAAAIA